MEFYIELRRRICIEAFMTFLSICQLLKGGTNDSDCRVAKQTGMTLYRYLFIYFVYAECIHPTLTKGRNVYKEDSEMDAIALM